MGLAALSLEPLVTLEEALADNRRLKDENQLLHEELARQRKCVAKLGAYAARLKAKLEVQQHRLAQTSQNSSRPPSTDPPFRQRPAKKPPSGRRAGGQPGHRGTHRHVVPPERVDEVRNYWPARCAECHAELDDAADRGDDDPVCHQVIEVPPARARIIEHRQHARQCPCCRAVTRAALPPDVPQGAFGPHTEALVGHLTGSLHASKRTAAAAMQDLFGVPMSTGAVTACEAAVSTAVAGAVDQAQHFMERQPSANVDETSWRQGRKRAWLWVASTALVTVFLITVKRSREASYRLLGTFAGIMGSDRFSAYDDRDPQRRQLCWAHLIRDFTAWSERGGADGELGRTLLGLVRDQMFGWWHRVRDGTLTRVEFQACMEPLMAEVKRLLEGAATGASKKIAATSRFLLEVWPALWTFVHVEGVEPTNNQAERSLRPGVLWRKRSFGTHSEAGSRFVERMMTVTTTLQQQNRPVLDFLVASLEAQRRGLSPPSLLPENYRAGVPREAIPC